MGKSFFKKRLKSSDLLHLVCRPSQAGSRHRREEQGGGPFPARVEGAADGEVSLCADGRSSEDGEGKAKHLFEGGSSKRLAAVGNGDRIKKQSVKLCENAFFTPGTCVHIQT